MHLVDHHALEPGEQREAIGVAEQKRQALGGCQQHVRGLDPLALLAVRRGVAAAGLDADRKPHLLDRGDEIALHVVRQRLQRADVERVDTIAGRRAAAGAKGGQGGHEPRQRLARAGIRDEQCMAARVAGGEHGRLMPPHPPAAAREPAFDLGRNRCHRHRQSTPRGKAPARSVRSARSRSGSA